MKFKEAYDAGSGAICWRIVFTVNNKEYALHVDNNTVTALEVGYESRFLPYISLLALEMNRNADLQKNKHMKMTETPLS